MSLFMKVECPQCGQSFTRDSSLKRHEISQHGNELHPCPTCPKVYARRDNLRKHQKKCRQAQAWLPNALSAPNVSVVENQPPQADVLTDVTATSDQVTTVQASQSSTPNAAVQHHQKGSVSVSYDNAPELLDLSILEMDLFSGMDLFDSMMESDQPNYLGRVDSTACVGMFEKVPSPSFLPKVVQMLQDGFPNASIEGKMHHCPVHRQTQVPMLHRPEPINLTAYKFQFVPTVKCMDCPNEIFLVTPFYTIGPIEDHLNSPNHAHRVRLRWIAESKTARDALLVTTAPPVIVTALAKLANGDLSLPGLDELYSAKSGQPLLVLAVKNAAIHVLRHLLDEGLKVAGTDSVGRTALHWAYGAGRSDMAELLVRYGARVSTLDKWLGTPLELAVQSGGLNTGVALIEFEASVRREASPEASETPLALACRYGHLAIIERMIESGENVNEGRINLPLHVAVRKASWRVVQILLAAGANPQLIPLVDRLTLMGRGADDGVTYPDAKEKVALLKQHGLRFKPTRMVSYCSRY